MYQNIKKLKIKLNSIDNSSSLNKNNKLEIDVFLDDKEINNKDLAQFISNHIYTRGFEDAVELNTISLQNSRNIESFVVIGNQVIRNLKFDEIIKVLNKELDKILYSALGSAKKDLLLSIS